MKLLLAAILVALCVLLVDSAVVEGSLEEQLNIYRIQIRVVYRQLAKECPGMLTSRREIPAEDKLLDLQTQKQVYAQLLSKLNRCKKLTTEKEIPTRQPIECLQAINYTQSWRRDHNGANIRPGGPNSYAGSACDMYIRNTEWFRFAGAAGNQMLNKCPKWLSCGGQWAYWTDAEMPEAVGVERTVNVYTVNKSDCKYKPYTMRVKVMRCSRNTDHDFIYKQTTNHTTPCDDAFCGMM